MMIIFFAFFFKIFREKALDKVSMVFPDFEIIMKSTFDIFFFLKLIIFSSFRSLKKNMFFLIFFLKNRK